MNIETLGVFSGEVSPTDMKLATKINELVAAVNEQELRLDNFKCWLVALENAKKPTISKMENVDPYAEQRKWIGKLCWFWTIYREHANLGILDHITDKGNFVNKDDNSMYANCEPIKSDDTIIYKGE